jgi:hydroxymethylbilane synthase
VNALSQAENLSSTQAVAPPARVRIGTRGSQLARWQAEWVAHDLRNRGVEVKVVTLTTQGDVQEGPLSAGGGVGLFTKEIQRALLSGEVDLAVHSLKDLPTEHVEGLALAAVPQRETVCDVLFSKSGLDLASLPPGATVGTGSTRRAAQLLYKRPDLKISPIRGNVETRLAKLDAGEYDAIVLAQAGVKRLGLLERPHYVIPISVMLPAVGQGALGLEARAVDFATRNAISGINHAESWAAVLAERALLTRLRAGCLAPVGAWARDDEGVLRLDGVVLSPDGRKRIVSTSWGDIHRPEALGVEVAHGLIAQGAMELIAGVRT